MKVAIFTDGFPPSFGGAEKAAERYASALSKTAEVAVLAPDNSKAYDDSAYPFKVIRVKSLAATKNDRYAMPFIDKKVKRFLEEFKPDIVHCQSVGQMAAYATRYAEKHGVPCVSTVHTKYYYCYKHSLKLGVLAKILLHAVMKRVKRATAVCAVSESMKRTLADYGVKNPVTVIRNGGEMDEKVVAERLNKKFTFIFAGLVVEYKNLDFSLRVLAELKKRGKDFVFYIVGEGPHIKKFKRLTNKLGLGDDVIFTGGLSDKQELLRYYAGSDLMLFTSVADSDGLVIVEAAGQGVPSVVVENTGTSERIENNVTGFICENSVEKFAERLEKIMDDEKLRAFVSQNVKGTYTSWEDNAKTYYDLYTQLIKNKGN